MECKPVYCAGTTPALTYTIQYLKRHNISIADYPQWDTGHLLLDVPSFRPGSILADMKHLDTLLAALPSSVTVWGGNLNHPSLEGLRQVDLLKDENYLAENAAITAHCAVQIAAPMIPCTFQNLPVLIIGWGRIGKCLAQLLKRMGADVTVAARCPAHRAALESLGYLAADCCDLEAVLPKFRLIFNTVPELIIPKSINTCCPDCIKIDLASQKGIDGDDVVWARGLPGIHAPESSGILIGKTFLKHFREVEK